MVLDDEPAIGRAVQRNLSDRFQVELEYEVAPVLARLQAGRADWDVFILDINLRGDIDGIEVLYHLRRSSEHTSVVMISGNDSANTAAACLRAGAFDYLTKPIRQTELSAAVSKAASHALARKHQLSMPPPSLQGPGGELSALIGSSTAIQEVRNRIYKVAPSNTTILIQGETGTGKELVARAIHDLSDRNQHRFVPINCGSCTEGLIDSELFGHVRGAYTGASEDRPGAFVEADDGTLFLDEIGDMPQSFQVRLLRAIQDREIRPLGSSSVRKVDVRIISATNVDLASAAEEKRFRADLFYRVNVFPMSLPPLRDRIEDIPELVSHFIQKHGGPRRRSKAIHVLPSVDRSTLEVLMSAPWPGNVRQLENVIQSALAVCEGPVIYPSHLHKSIMPRPLFAAPAASQGSWRAEASRTARGTETPVTLEPLATDSAEDLVDEPDAEDSAVTPLPEPPHELDGELFPPISDFVKKVTFESRFTYLHRLMLKASGNLTRASRIAGIDRANLRRLLRAHEINAAAYRKTN
jgi:DNA-binding NtrC family response regulator